MQISVRKDINHTRPRRRFLAAAMTATLGCVATALVANPASAQDTLAKVKKSGEMVVGTSAAYAPFEYRKDGNLVGFDIDLGQEVAKRMGVKIKWVEIDFKGIIAGLKSKRVDALITAMTKTPERAKQIDFSLPYFDAGVGAARPKGSSIAKPADLKGKVVGVQIGTSGERYVKGDLKNVGIKEIKTYDTILLALKDLENGRVDAVVNPLPSIKYNLKGLKGLDVTDVWVSRVVGINTRKEDADLLAQINKHLADLKKEGYLDKLTQKWF